MRKQLAAVLTASLVFSGAAVTFAAQDKKPAAHKEHAAKEMTAKGTVSSITDSMLTLKTKKGEQHFTVNTTTKKDGIATGQNVVVHYKMDGKTMVATGVMAGAPMSAKKK